MNGDRHKPQSSFGRWIDNFWDGMFKRTRKGKTRIPSFTDKRYERRWRRHEAKKEIQAL